MTTTIIYSPKGDTREVPITKDARVFRQLGGDYYVELPFEVDKTLALPKGSYILVSDSTTDSTTDPETDNAEKYAEKYALRSDATPEPISGVNGYKYVLKFYSRQHDMEACQIKWLAGSRQELSFRVTTSLRGFAQLIADNMNKYFNPTDDPEVPDVWSFDGELDDTDMREQSFEGVSCWEAINSIANLFGVEWWVDHGDKLTIHFGKCENDGDETVIREGEIVNCFPAPKRGDDSNYGTRFYIFGGSQNVPDTYNPHNNTSVESSTFHIAEKRICLCEHTDIGIRKDYIPYFDAIKVPQAEIVEKTIILNDIFPKNETTIREGDILEQEEYIIEGDDKQPVYYIKVSEPPTVLSTIGITFTSGALSGRSFGAAYTTLGEVSYIKVLHTTENSGGASLIAVPNDNLKPKAGDTYILTGVKLKKDRIDAAEFEVWKKGTALARQYVNDTNVYDCPVNPVYCKEQKVNLALGDKVILWGAHFGEKGRKSRIQGYEKKLYNPYIATYNIGDNSVYSRTAKVVKDIQLPIAEAVASTERKNDRLSAQISSMQSNQQLTSIIQRLNYIEGYDTDTDTADSVSIPGAKKYAEQVAEEAAKAEGEAVKDAVAEGIPGTKNFGIYAGKMYGNTFPVGGGIYVKITPQFEKVYNPTKANVSLDQTVSVAAILPSDAPTYNGAVIYITGDVDAGVLSDNALIANDVVMAVGGKWVKINDTNTEVTEEYVKSLLQSSDVKASIFKELTGVEYADQVVDIRMPVVSVTRYNTEALYPNRIYYYYETVNTTTFVVPALTDAGLKADCDNKWILRGYAQKFSFSNWKTDENSKIYYLWDKLPHEEGGTFSGYFEITVRRIAKYFTLSGTSYFYLISFTTYGSQYK